jgi:anhydro-N-acetylmuramic acid kinase
MADLFIGLMSGTSMDGIDTALVDFTSRQPNILATHNHCYPAVLQQQLENALGLAAPLNTDLATIDDAVGDIFSVATNELLGKAGIEAEQVTAIGSHGQTIRHDPDATRTLLPATPALMLLRISAALISRPADREHRWYRPFTRQYSRTTVKTALF